MAQANKLCPGHEEIASIEDDLKRMKDKIDSRTAKIKRRVEGGYYCKSLFHFSISRTTVASGIYIALSIPFTIFLIQGFFRSLPSVLEEASYIDGCGPMRTFFSIMLPLGKPGLIAAAIFNFISLWNEFLLALTFVNDSADYPLSVGLYALQGSLQYTGDWVALFAALVVITLPTLLIYVFLSRQIIDKTSLLMVAAKVTPNPDVI